MGRYGSCTSIAYFYIKNNQSSLESFMASQYDPNEINRLIGEFTDLQEQWEAASNQFNWLWLESLAQRGAHAYNEGAGPSFHALAIDGTQHSEFHERFLAYSIQAGFDPFKLAKAGETDVEIPVIDHATLAESSDINASSARMRATLMEIARSRFSALAQEIQNGKSLNDSGLLRQIEACAESFPLDLLENIAPELARVHHERLAKQNYDPVDPVEGYLSTAEVIVDDRSNIYG
jgi:hypothetical protein